VPATSSISHFNPHSNVIASALLAYLETCAHWLRACPATYAAPLRLAGRLLFFLLAASRVDRSARKRAVFSHHMQLVLVLGHCLLGLAWPQGRRAA